MMIDEAQKRFRCKFGCLQPSNQSIEALARRPDPVKSTFLCVNLGSVPPDKLRARAMRDGSVAVKVGREETAANFFGRWVHAPTPAGDLGCC